MTGYVLDTNIVTYALDNHPLVTQRLQLTLDIPGDIIWGCPVVWYEARRGFKSRDAKSQMARFEALFATFEWQDFTPADWTLAADLWAARRAQGRPIADADLLIAVFTRNRNAVLVTNNVRDFTGLNVITENWLL